MKKIFDFIEEGRRPGSKNKPKDQQNPQENPQEEPQTLDDAKGEDAEDNGTEGVWEIEPPTEDDITKGLDRENITKNVKRIAKRLSAGLPFFIQGEAGWGKTSIITDVAHKFGYTVITVYLDKAEPEDLGGLPTAEKDKSGQGYQTNLLPGWAHIMKDNPKTKFLLFFDEMNQAQPAVMNALMPIVLKNVIAGKKFKNFVVGAAGNFAEENKGGISELSGPLESRFGGVIVWQSGDWASAMRFLKKKYTGRVSEAFIDKVESCCDYFKNPRDVERFIIGAVENIKKDSKNADLYDAEDYLEDLERIAKSDIGRSGKDALEELADAMVKFVNGAAEENKESGRKKTRQMLDPDMAEAIMNSIKNGFMIQDGVKYGISRENIGKLTLDETVINAEMLQRFIDSLDEDGIKYKYEKDEEWKKAGYEDPFNAITIGKSIIKDNKPKKQQETPKKKRSIKDYTKS